MTDEQIIRWACEWVGWRYVDPGFIHDPVNGSPEEGHSINDLAEAVRVNWFAFNNENPGEFGDSPGDPGRELAEIKMRNAWLYEGPLAFIRAVREVVEG